MALALIPILATIVVIILIPVLIGVYVYRDATRRGMNAALWTLIAVLAPTLIGFIIYLLARGNYSDLKCPACAATVDEQYVVCPRCGTKLRASCPNCGTPTENGWKVCPKCASSLPEHDENYMAPIRKKDNALGKILALVVLVPIVLIVLLGVLSFSRLSVASSMGTAQLRVDDYVEHPEVTAWINKCNEDPSKTYALCYKAEHVGQKETCYLIYRPSGTGTDSVDAGNGSGLFGSYVEVKFSESPIPADDEYKLTSIDFYSNKFANLRVYANGKKIACEITEVNYNPAQIELHSEAGIS